MPVLVLNASYEPLNVVPVRRAVVLLLKARAEVVEGDDEVPLRSESWAMTRPIVIRLVTYVRVPRLTHRRVTRRAVLARDQWTCQYCGSTSDLTIDHVLPRSKGGETEWTNITTSCWPCNRRKGSASPQEAGMRLTQQPRIPQSTVFVFVAVRRPPEAWDRWLLR